MVGVGNDVQGELGTGDPVRVVHPPWSVRARPEPLTRRMLVNGSGLERMTLDSPCADRLQVLLGEDHRLDLGAALDRCFQEPVVAVQHD